VKKIESEKKKAMKLEFENALPRNKHLQQRLDEHPNKNGASVIA